MATWLLCSRKAPCAILRGIRPAEIPGIAAALIGTGFRILGSAAQSPEPLESIARLGASWAEALVGARHGAAGREWRPFTRRGR